MLLFIIYRPHMSPPASMCSHRTSAWNFAARVAKFTTAAVEDSERPVRHVSSTMGSYAQAQHWTLKAHRFNSTTVWLGPQRTRRYMSTVKIPEACTLTA